MRVRKTVAVGISMVLASGAALPLRAATTDVEVVVTATRDRQEVAKIPANATVITGEEIRRNGNVSVTEALKTLEGIEVRSFSGNASQAEVTMRGFGENAHGRVLVLLNGRRLNRPDMSGINWLEVPVNNVDRIEVVRGGNSALYGDFAVGGVINIITRTGTPTPQYDASILVGSYNTYVERAGASGSGGGLSYAVNAERQESDGYRKRSGYTAWGGGADLGYDLSEAVNGSLSCSYDASDFDLPGYLTKAQMKADPRQSVNSNDTSRSSFVNVDMGLNATMGAEGRGEANFIYGLKKMDSDLASWSSFSDVRIDTFGVTPRYVLDRDLLGRANKLISGVDYYEDILKVDRFADDTRGMKTSDAEVTKDSLGVYAKDEWELTEDWIVDAGARTETAHVDAESSASGATIFNGDKTHYANAVDAGLVRRIGEASKVFARAGTVYRFPFVDEQVSYIGYGTDQIYMDIDAEKGETYELGSEVALSKWADVGVTLFLLNMRDEIAWNAITMRNENLDRTRHEGVEASASVRMTQAAKLGARYTFTDASFTRGVNDGNDIPLVPSHKASLILDYALPYDVSVRGTATYVGSQYLGGDAANAGPKLAEYTVVDFLARYEPKAVKGLELFAGMDNAFGEKYASVAYKGFAADGYYPSPERSYKAGASYRF